jgi:hypothetical protein
MEVSTGLDLQRMGVEKHPPSVFIFKRIRDTAYKIISNNKRINKASGRKKAGRAMLWFEHLCPLQNSYWNLYPKCNCINTWNV